MCVWGQSVWGEREGGGGGGYWWTAGLYYYTSYCESVDREEMLLLDRVLSEFARDQRI